MDRIHPVSLFICCLHLPATPLQGMEKYLHALETASWSLFPTSLEEDTDDGKSKSTNLQMATALRRGYKELLRDAIDSLRVRLSGGG